MNPEWLKTGKFSEHLERINLVLSKLPITLKYILIAGVMANIGVWIKLICDWIMLFYNYGLNV